MKRSFLILAVLLIFAIPTRAEEPVPPNAPVVVVQPSTQPTQVVVKAEVDMSKWSPASVKELVMWALGIIPTALGIYLWFKSKQQATATQVLADNTTELNRVTDPMQPNVKSVSPETAAKTSMLGTGPGSV